MKKTMKFLLALAMGAAMGSSAQAASVNVQLVGTEAKSVTSSSQVTRNYYYKYVLGNNAGTYVSTDHTSATQVSSKTTVSATFTGKAFTPGSATITLQQSSSRNSGYSTLDTFTVYVANAYDVTVEEGAETTLAASTFSAISSGTSNWTIDGASDTTVKAVRSDSGSVTRPEIKLTGVKEGSYTLKVYSDTNKVALRYQLNVTVTPKPDTVDFKGRKIEYLNAAVTKLNGDKELLVAFTDTTKTGILTIPEDATARILVVGGGAGGATGKAGSQTAQSKKAYNGTGGNAGQVIEKTQADGYVLPAGSYAVTIGAGGAAAPANSSKDFTGGGAGSKSSFIGGDVSIEAVGGAAWGTNDAESDGVFANGSKMTGGTSLKAHDGYGAAGNNDPQDDTDWRLGVSSDIMGETKDYGVGGIGPNSISSVTGTAGGANTGNGGGGGAQGGASGAGGSGFVCVRITYPDPVYVETFSVTPILKGDALFTSAITLSMTNAAGEKVAGTYDWTERDTVPPASGDYVVRFTPEDTTAYAVVELTANVVVLVPQEPTVTVVADDQIAGEVTTELAGSDWNFIVSFGVDVIQTPILSVNDDGTATLKVNGIAGKTGTAYIDLYAGGTFVKRVIVAVLPKPGESETLSVEEGRSKSSTQTTASAAQWNYVVEVGADFIETPTLSGGNRPTLTVVGKTAGTAIVDLFSGSATPGQGTLQKRVIVNVVGPTEGYENRAVGTTLSITVKTEATVDDSEITSGSGVTVTGTGTSTTIKGGATVGATAQVRLYADGTLVKVVNVQVTDKPSTITWKNRTVSYLGGTAAQQANGDLLVTLKDSDGLLEIPETAIGDILVVGGGGSGSSAVSNYRGNGGGGGKALYETNLTFASGVYTATVGAGGATTAVPSEKAGNGNYGSASEFTDGDKFLKTAAGGLRGEDGVSSTGTASAGKGGAELSCGITGSSVTYGSNGAGGTGSGAGAAGTANTGNGGKGAGTNGTGGAGGSGVIIVRLKGFVETPAVLEPVTGTITYGETATDAVFAGKMKNGAGEEVDGTFAWANAGAVQPLTVEASGTEYDVVFTPENTTYYLPATVKGTLIVLPATPVVTTWPGATDVYSGQTLAASTLTGGVAAVTGTFGWADKTIEPTDGGSYDVVFTPENDNYLPVTNKVQVTVLPGVPVPTAKTGLVYTGLEQTGVVEGVGYTLVGNTGTDAKTYTATATLTIEGSCWAGGSTEPTNITWTIAQADVTVTGDSTSKVYGAADPTFTATVAGTNGFDGVTIAIDDPIVRTNTCEDVGTYDIVPTGDADQGNYLVSFVPGTFEITRAPVAKPTAKIDLVYTGGCQTGVVAGVGYVLADNVATNAGTYTVTATLDGNHKWNDDSTEDAEIAFTIAPKEISVTAHDQTVKPGDPFNPTDYTADGLIDPDTLTGELACAYNPEDAEVGAEFDILQGSLTNANYTISTFTPGKLRVASLQVALDPAGRVYDGTAFSSNNITFTVKKNDGTTVTEFLVEGPETMLNASNYEFKVTSGDLEGTAYFTVSQATVTVSAISTNKVYSGDAATDPELTATVEGLVNGESEDRIEYTLTREIGEDVGDYAIKADFKPSQGNYWVSFVPATFTIERKAVTVTANSATKTYGEEDPEFTATVVGTNGTVGVTYTFARDEGDVATNATPYVIRPVSINDDYTGNIETQGNYIVTYNWSDAPGTLTINRKSVTVTIASTNLVYGDVYPDWESSAGDLPYGNKLDYTLAPLNCDGSAREAAYEIVPVVYNTNGNYNVTFVNGKLRIDRLPILVTVVATNKVYGAEDPALAYVVSNAEGTAELKTLPNGTNVVLNGYLVRTAGEDVKDSPYDVDTLTYFNETNNPNYVFEAALDGENKFAILPAPLLVQADDKSKLFGWDDPEWTATFTGLTNGDTKADIACKVKCGHSEAVGTYPIVASGATPQGGAFGLNYDITYSNGWFEICAGKMSVTTNGVTRDYDDIDAAFEALLAKGGTAIFNEDVVFGGSTFAKGSTLTVNADGSWSTDGTLTLAEDICVGTVIAASNVVLTTDVTVGVTEEVTNELAILTFKEIDLSTNKLTLTTNGVVRSAEKLEIEKVFVEHSKAYEVVEAAITGGWEYTAVLHGFTITFNSNGGSAVEPIVAPAGETVEGPEGDPTRTGYGFDGWYTNDVMKVEFPLTMPMADFTLDAHWTTNRYKVVYDANGGTGGPATSNATYDVTFAISGNPDFAKTGYSFNSWTNAAGDVFLIGAVTNNLTATDGDSVTLYAAWTPNVYTLIYTAGAGEGADVETNLTYDVEHTVIANPFAKTGYSFTGWTNLVDNLGYQPGDVVVNLTNEPNATVTWTAAWTANVYTITFNSNGGSVVAPIAAACDATISAPAAPAKTGYAFQGWFTNNAESAYVFTTMPAGGLALTAKWAPNAYTVAYDPNGGEGASVTNGATYDAAFDIADCTFTKTGYTFGGWTTNVNVAVKFLPGDSVSNLTATAGATVKFYAAWTPNVYTLTYKAGEGTGKDIVSNMVYDVEYEVADCTFAKMGYSFKEWTNEVGTAYLPGQAIKNLTDVKGGNMDFTAVWTANVYTITFDTKGGSTVDPITAACDAPITEPADPTKTGYTFGGWTTNGVTVTFPATMPAGGLALAAKWTPNAYTVKYNANGGTGDAATSNATYDVEFAISGNPGFAKTGYSFNSWTNAAGTVFAFGTATNNLTATDGDSVTLYAAWMPNGYTLTYKSGEGTGDDIVLNMIYDVEYEVADCTFAKNGYSFKEWTNEVGTAYRPGQAITNLAFVPNGNVDFTATWTANVYQVTFDSAGGTLVEPIVAKCDEVISGKVPANPTRDWYTFQGWFTNNAESAYVFTTMPAGGIALTAKWSADPGNPENPWTVGPNNSTNVLAYVDPELGMVVIDFVGTNVIDLVALTNGLAEAGVAVDPKDFNAVVKTGDNAFVTPAGWLDANDPEDPTKFNTTLGGALEDGIDSVVVCETEPPAEIIETREVEIGSGVSNTVTAVVVNDPSGVETNAIQVTAVEGLAEIAEGQKTDVTLRVAATNKNAVGEATVWALMSANTNGLENVSGYQASYVDLSAKFGDDPVTDLGEGNVVTLFIPWTVDARFIYRIARIHNGEPEPIPEGEANQNDFGEYLELAEDGVILHARRFSTYAFAEIVAELSGVALIEVDDADTGVREGTNLIIRVTGGNRDFSSSVQLQVVYGTAVSSDFDLKNTKINGAIDTAFKFPYTLTWEKGALGEQTIEIPVKVPSKPKAERDLTFELQNPMNLTLEGVDRLVANKSYRKAKILGKLGPVTDKFYVRAVPNDATRGKTSGSALVAAGKKVAVKATANKGFVFTGWEGLEGLGSLEGLDSRSASISFSAPTNSVDLVARFEPLAEDYLELTDDFLPAEIELNKVFSNAVSVASGSLPTITVSGLPAGLKYYAKETLVKATKTTPAYTVPANTIYGIPTKASATNKTTKVVTPSKVKVTVKNLGGYKIVRTYELRVTARTTALGTAKVVGDDKPYAAVSVALSDDAAGKVTGAGLYQAGKKVTLKATANKGYVFEKWEGLGSLGGLEGLDLSKANLSFVMPSSNVTLVAQFALPDEITDPKGKNPCAVAVVRNNDFAGNVTGAGYYQQGKKVTLKATALKGYVFSGWYRDAAFEDLITQDASLVIASLQEKRVRYYAVFVTAAEDLASIETAVNGMALTPGSGKDSASPLPTNVMCGVTLQWSVVSTALSLPKVAVSGLPSGLKFTAKPVTAKVNGVTVTNVLANTIYGAPTAASKPDKPSAVKVTVTTSGKSKAEYRIDLTVDPLPVYAVGTFDGPVFAADGTTNGVVKLTVAKSGKISGTIQTNCVDAAAKKLTLSVASFADYDLVTGDFKLVPTYKDGKETVEVPLTLSGAVVEEAVTNGVIVADDQSLVAYQNVLKGAAAEDFIAPTLFDGLTATVAKDGVLKFAGTVGGVKASGSSQIYYDALADEQGYRAVIYLPSKKGFNGVAEIVEVDQKTE